MTTISRALCFLILVATFADAAKPMSQSDWPWWRGPSRDGIAAADQKPPLKWSEKENVVWKSPVPGRGHGSMTVVGDQVLLATADLEANIQSVHCFDFESGSLKWESKVHEGGLKKKGNKKASLASTTVACDGEKFYVNFLNNGAVYTTALTRDGMKVWQTKISDYVVHQGYGSSPAIYKSLVIVSADNKGGGLICALERETGKVVWKHSRPKKPNYASPVVLNAAGRDQLVFTGCNVVASYDPMSGEKLWETAGSTTECVTSTVTDGKHVFTSGGYPKNHVSAVLADGSGKVAWENTSRVYVPSMFVHNNHLYATMDAGVATCWNCETGELKWKGRLGGTFSASPVLVGDHIFATNESGVTFIWKSNPEEFELVGENQLGEEVFATPTICRGRIFMRVASRTGGTRQETLYCLGE